MALVRPPSMLCDMKATDAMFEHRIRQRAHEIYQARQENPASYDWLQAEREILKETSHFERTQTVPETGSVESGIPSRK